MSIQLENLKFYLFATVFVLILSVVTETISILSHLKVNGDKFTLFKKSLANSFLLAFTFFLVYFVLSVLSEMKIYSDKFAVILKEGLSYSYVGIIGMLLIKFIARIYVRINGKIEMAKYVKLILGLKSGKIDNDDIKTIDNLFQKKPNKQKRSNDNGKNDIIW